MKRRYQRRPINTSGGVVAVESLTKRVRALKPTASEITEALRRTFAAVAR